MVKKACIGNSFIQKMKALKVNSKNSGVQKRPRIRKRRNNVSSMMQKCSLKNKKKATNQNNILSMFQKCTLEQKNKTRVQKVINDMKENERKRKESLKKLKEVMKVINRYHR